MEHQYDVGVVTGNWGCGAFGGDPEIKTTIQWLAASQVTPPLLFKLSTSLCGVVGTIVIEMLSLKHSLIKCPRWIEL